MSVRVAPPAQLGTEWGVERLDLAGYLARVRCPQPPPPTADGLRRLHRAHLGAICFENLDVALGRGVSTDLVDIQAKLVDARRGGYCHEHNLLFAAALEQLGFEVTRLLARARDDGRVVLPRGHATLLVRADGATWLTDVGFGSDGLLEPLRLAEGRAVRQGGWAYRLERRGADWVLRAGLPDASVLYSFTPGEYRRADFEQANYFVSTHPSSPFATELIVQRTSADARYALRGLDLTITLATRRKAHRRVAARDLRAVLRDTFALDLTAGEAHTLAAFVTRPPKQTLTTARL